MMDNYMRIFTGQKINHNDNNQKKTKSKNRQIIQYKKIQPQELNEKVFNQKIKLNESKGKKLKKLKQQELIQQSNQHHNQQHNEDGYQDLYNEQEYQQQIKKKEQEQDIGFKDKSQSLFSKDSLQPQFFQQEPLTIDQSNEAFKNISAQAGKNRDRIIEIIQRNKDEIQSTKDEEIKKKLYYENQKLTEIMLEDSLNKMGGLLKRKLEDDQNIRGKYKNWKNLQSTEFFKYVYQQALESEKEFIKQIIVEDWNSKKVLWDLKDNTIQQFIDQIKLHSNKNYDEQQVKQIADQLSNEFNTNIRKIKVPRKINKQELLEFLDQKQQLGEYKMDDIQIKPDQSKIQNLLDSSYNRLQREQQRKASRDKFSQNQINVINRPQSNKSKQDSFQSLSPQHQHQDDVRPVTMFQTAFENDAQRDTYEAKKQFVKPIIPEVIQVKQKQDNNEEQKQDNKISYPPLQQRQFQTPQQSIIQKQYQSPFSDIDIPSKIQELKQISTQTSALKNHIEQKQDKLVVEQLQGEDKQNKERIEKLEQQLDDSRQQYDSLLQQKIQQQKEINNISQQLVEQKKINEQQNNQLKQNIDKLQSIIQSKEQIIQNSKQDNQNHIQDLKDEKLYLQQQLEIYQQQVNQLSQERIQLNQQLTDIRQYYQQNIYQQKINVVNYNPGQQDQQQFIQEEHQQVNYPLQQIQYQQQPLQQIQYQQEPQLQYDDDDDNYLQDDFNIQEEQKQENEQVQDYNENDTINKFLQYLQDKGIHIKSLGQGSQKIKNRLNELQNNRIIQTDNLNIDFYLLLDMYHKQGDEQILQQLSNVIQRKYNKNQLQDIIYDLQRLENDRNQQILLRLANSGYFQDNELIQQINQAAEQLELKRQQSRQITGQGIVQRQRNQ